MEENEHDSDGFDKIDNFLNNIKKEVDGYETDIKHQHTFFLGRDVRNFILSGTVMDEEHRKLFSYALSDAIEVFCGDSQMSNDTFDTLEKKIVFQTIRDAFVGAMHSLVKLHYPEEVAEIVQAFYSVLLKSEQDKEKTAQCLEFIVLTMMELQQ